MVQVTLDKLDLSEWQWGDLPRTTEAIGALDSIAKAAAADIAEVIQAQMIEDGITIDLSPFSVGEIYLSIGLSNHQTHDLAAHISLAALVDEYIEVCTPADGTAWAETDPEGWEDCGKLATLFRTLADKLESKRHAAAGIMEGGGKQ